MARNSTQRLGGDYDLELRGSVVCCTLSTRSQPTFQHLKVWYNADFEGAVFLLFSCTAVLQHRNTSNDCIFPRKLCVHSDM